MGGCQGIVTQLLGYSRWFTRCCYMVAIACSGWLLGHYDAVATVFQVNERVIICGC